VVTLLAILSGLLLSTSFAPIGIWWIAPLAIALLLKSLERASLSGRMISLYIFGLSFFGPLLHWSSTYVGAMPWIILTVLESLFFIPLALIPSIRTWFIFLFPSVWVALEGIRARFPFGGFGWGRLAFGQPDAPYASLAGVGGVPLLSFFTVFIGVFLYLIISRQWNRTVLASVLIITLFSSSLLQHHPRQVPTFSIVAIQGGVPKLGLDFNARASAVFHNHLNVTEEYLQMATHRPELIIWPENSVDVDPFYDLQVSKELQNEVDKYQIPILIGAVLDKGTYFENASILWTPKIGATSRYIKQHLTPFGEYVPLRTLAEFVSPFAKNVTGFRPGHAVVLHHVQNARIAPIICYELLDDQLGREMARESNLLVVQTNSATFGLSAESAQQLAITRIRAIEHQREIVSVATSGISAIIDTRGRVLQRTQQNRPATITHVVSLIEGRSVADRLGVRLELFLVFLPLLIWVTVLMMRRRRPL
jgi:apolipoprotein N-acyltransferase